MKSFKFLIIILFLSINSFAQTSTGWQTIYESNIGKIDMMVTFNDPNAKKHMHQTGVYFRTNIPYSVHISVYCKEITSGYDNGKPRYNQQLQSTFFNKANNWRESDVLVSGDVKSFKGAYINYLQIENQVLFRNGQEISQFYYNSNGSNNSSSTYQNGNNTSNNNYKDFTDLVAEHNRVCQELMNTANNAGKNSSMLTRYCQQGGNVNDSPSNRTRLKNEINEMNNEIHTLKYSNNSSSSGTNSMNRGGNVVTGNSNSNNTQEDLIRKQAEEQQKIESYVEIGKTAVNLLSEVIKERKANKGKRLEEGLVKYFQKEVEKANDNDINSIYNLAHLLSGFRALDEYHKKILELHFENNKGGGILIGNDFEKFIYEEFSDLDEGEKLFKKLINNKNISKYEKTLKFSNLTNEQFLQFIQSIREEKLLKIRALNSNKNDFYVQINNLISNNENQYIKTKRNNYIAQKLLLLVDANIYGLKFNSNYESSKNSLILEISESIRNNKISSKSMLESDILLYALYSYYISKEFYKQNFPYNKEIGIENLNKIIIDNPDKEYINKKRLYGTYFLCKLFLENEDCISKEKFVTHLEELYKAHSYINYSYLESTTDELYLCKVIGIYIMALKAKDRGIQFNIPEINNLTIKSVREILEPFIGLMDNNVINYLYKQ